ncbi:MAG TPA: carbohydrate binding family 9 domain-containing protein [Candidatus Sulfotelmatobacter sp.]|nr:carbohydrate binding family 9 domain-containing protein [Candidatus Sulfotelmatobacter sp.]
MTKNCRRFFSGERRIKGPRLLVVMFLAIAAHRASAKDGPSAAALIRNPSSIVLDGRLDEPEWRDAPVLRLVQQSPKPGATTPYETEVRIIVSGDRIFFGFDCKDPYPTRLSIHSMRRDETMGQDGQTLTDDTVSIVLDTYGDRRTGYFFQINAAGTRTDGLISNPESVSLDWDGIWDARTARTKDGWSAEIVIPSRTLSFTRGLGEWGLNLERFVPRERLALRWSSHANDSPYAGLPPLSTPSSTISAARELCRVSAIYTKDVEWKFRPMALERRKSSTDKARAPGKQLPAAR